MNTTGVIGDIRYVGREQAAFLYIDLDDGTRLSVSDSRLINAPGGHRCLARPGDEVNFTATTGRRILQVRFTNPPEWEPEEEVSIIHSINNNMIWGQRIKPACRCPILIGMTYHYPELDEGMFVTHNIGKYRDKVTAINVRVNSEYVPADADAGGESNETYASAGA